MLAKKPGVGAAAAVMRSADLQVRSCSVFAGSAPLQWRFFVDYEAHERHWSGALPAMSGPGGPRSG